MIGGTMGEAGLAPSPLFVVHIGQNCRHRNRLGLSQFESVGNCAQLRGRPARSESRPQRQRYAFVFQSWLLLLRLRGAARGRCGRLQDPMRFWQLVRVMTSRWLSFGGCSFERVGSPDPTTAIVVLETRGAGTVERSFLVVDFQFVVQIIVSHVVVDVHFALQVLLVTVLLRIHRPAELMLTRPAYSWRYTWSSFLLRLGQAGAAWANKTRRLVAWGKLSVKWICKLVQSDAQNQNVAEVLKI